MPAPATLPDVEHHTLERPDTTLHYVTAGATGSPILLVHGFPETWWAFRHVIPLLAARHRVIAVDLRGFGDSGAGEGADYSSAASAEDLHALVGHLGFGPVHLTVQDVSGETAYRFAAAHPADVLSFTAIETGLPGFGAEMLADVVHGGAWYLGAFAAPGVPELLFTGREREFLIEYLYPMYGVTAPALSTADADEFVRTYAREGGWRGAAGLYGSMLADGAAVQQIASSTPLGIPVLAVGGFGGPFTFDSLKNVTPNEVRSVQLDGVGHYIAQQAPEQLVDAIVDFVDEVDAARPQPPAS